MRIVKKDSTPNGNFTDRHLDQYFSDDLGSDVQLLKAIVNGVAAGIVEQQNNQKKDEQQQKFDPLCYSVKAKPVQTESGDRTQFSLVFMMEPSANPADYATLSRAITEAGLPGLRNYVQPEQKTVGTGKGDAYRTIAEALADTPAENGKLIGIEKLNVPSIGEVRLTAETPQKILSSIRALEKNREPLADKMPKENFVMVERLVKYRQLKKTLSDNLGLSA